jgi:hypothetical protein
MLEGALRPVAALALTPLAFDVSCYSTKPREPAELIRARRGGADGRELCEATGRCARHEVMM